MRKLLIAACALAMLPWTMAPGAALAEPAGAGPHFAAGPVGHFAGRDLAAWRGGHWWHGWRGGRAGWWWFVDGYGYWYGAQVWPYPPYVADVSAAGAYAAPHGRVWWFCDGPAGYYPYVHACPTPWRPVKPTTDPVFPPP